MSQSSLSSVMVNFAGLRSVLTLVELEQPTEDIAVVLPGLVGVEVEAAKMLHTLLLVMAAEAVKVLHALLLVVLVEEEPDVLQVLVVVVEEAKALPELVVQEAADLLVVVVEVAEGILLVPHQLFLGSRNYLA